MLFEVNLSQQKCFSDGRQEQVRNKILRKTMRPRIRGARKHENVKCPEGMPDPRVSYEYTTFV